MKLSYEDCKELKDAGFTYKNGRGYLITPKEWVNQGKVGGESLWEYLNIAVYEPTLSELIEVLGERRFNERQNMWEQPVKVTGKHICTHKHCCSGCCNNCHLVV